MKAGTIPIALALAATLARAQEVADPWIARAQVIVPHSRPYAFALAASPQPIRVELVKVSIAIVDQSARTVLEVAVTNPDAQPQEAVLLLPVPEGAAISAFAFDGTASEPTAKLLPRDEARRVYDQIVQKLRDPALLEFAGSQLVRSSVFPVPARGAQKLRLVYEHVLERDGARIDYVLPRSESVQHETRWQVEIDVRTRAPLAMLYSPSHELVTERVAKKHMRARLAERSGRDPGSFLLSCVTESDGLGASLFAYPDPKLNGGYFLLLASLPPPPENEHQRREVTVVLDRSGSMAGKKMDQAKAATLQVLEGLEAEEGFNVIDYSTAVAAFAAAPVRKSKDSMLKAREYVEHVPLGGGTNIHDALVEALRQKPLADTLPLVLFLTDGLPTIGSTSEAAIRELIEKGNPHGRRVFTFGVGHDVNAPLLDRIAELSRASTTYVLPTEDIEVKVARLFKKLEGPVLESPELIAREAEGAPDTRRMRELQPARLPDFFAQDQLVVLGQYRGNEPMRLELCGRRAGKTHRYALSFDLTRATTRNAFVPRLWATRQIAALIDQVRQSGAGAVGLPQRAGTTFADPRLRELSNEILRLSTEFGVLSEYTAFLATEGQDLSDWKALTAACQDSLDGRAVRTRSGIAAFNQGCNLRNALEQRYLAPRNAYFDEQMNRVETSAVQQVCDRAFFRRGERWIDGGLIVRGNLTPDLTIRLGTPEHTKLLERLEAQGRQGTLSLQGETLLEIEGKNVLITTKQ